MPLHLISSKLSSSGFSSKLVRLHDHYARQILLDPRIQSVMACLTTTLSTTSQTFPDGRCTHFGTSKGGADVDQIYLAPELFKQRRLTSFLSPQMSLFRKSSCMVGGQLPLGGLAGGESLALAASSTVSIFCHIHAAAAAVLNVLAVPDRLCPHLRERMRVIGAPADGIRHGDGPPGRSLWRRLKPRRWTSE